MESKQLDEFQVKLVSYLFDVFEELNSSIVSTFTSN